MRALLILALCLGSALAAVTCPPLYVFEDGIGCVRTLVFADVPIDGNFMPNMRAQCAKDGAHLPIIRNEQEDKTYNRLFNSNKELVDSYLILDITCNRTTRRLEWIDGSAIAFPAYLSTASAVASPILDFDCVVSKDTIASLPTKNSWYRIHTPYDHPSAVLCVNDDVKFAPIECPPLYELEDGIGCIRPLFYNVDVALDALFNANAREKCAADGAHLPIIRNEQEDKTYNMLFNSNPDLVNSYLILDIICNATTRRLEWFDGSAITFPAYLFSPTNQLDFDCVSTMDTMASFPSSFSWYRIHTPYNHLSTVYCVYDEGMYRPVEHSTIEMDESTLPTKLPDVNQCGDFTPMKGFQSSEQPCYKAFTQQMSWQSAQLECSAAFASLVTINSKEENDFFRQVAVERKLPDGIHIGAHLSSASSKTWTWVDSDAALDDKTYNNFIESFPIPGAGDCAAMLTGTEDAPWLNEDCTDNEMPFICRRAAFSSDDVVSCPVDSPKAGEKIISPGFPNSNIPCQYVMFVDSDKLVELEILTLITDQSKDVLEIFEGPAGSNLIANLTGTIVASTKFTTEKSNVIRMNWKPSGAASGRGFKVKYSVVEDNGIMETFTITGVILSLMFIVA